MRRKNYQAGLRDLEAILDNYSKTLVADDALLEQAKYKLEIERNPADVRKLTETLRKVYADSDSVPMSWILDGRSALVAGRSPADVSLAIENFERVPRLFRGNAAIPEAMYRAASAARIGGNIQAAVRQFADLATRYPNSDWAATGLLESALAMIRAGQPAGRAMEQLQRVRARFPHLAEEATAAHEWNTLLFRLYLRATGQAAFQLDEGAIRGPSGRLRDVTDLAVSERKVFVATKTGVTVYPAQGSPSPLVASNEPRALFFDRDGQFLTVHELNIKDAAGRQVPLEMPPDGDHPLRLKLEDAVMTASGEYLLADRDRQAIYRFTAAGKPAGQYAMRLGIRRLAVDDLDQVAVLGDKSVVLLGRDGKGAGQIAERGATYRLQDPVDICVDRFGHVYVLEKSAVFVFTPDGSRLLTTFTLPQRVEAQLIAVDSSGRLYVFDGRTDAVQIYR